MARPYIQYSAADLASEVSSARASKDIGKLKQLFHELSFRDARGARELRATVEKLIANGGVSTEPEFGGLGETSREQPTRSSATKEGTKPRPSGSKSPLGFTPTREQLA